MCQCTVRPRRRRTVLIDSESLLLAAKPKDGGKYSVKCYPLVADIQRDVKSIGIGPKSGAI